MLTGYAVGKESLPTYWHKYSPKKFTQPQLFACLVLRVFLKTDYRGVVAHLQDNSSLCEAINLVAVPHFTTLQKTERRLLTYRPFKRLLRGSLHIARRRRRSTRLAAMDSTGLESRYTSHYFVQRRSRELSKWQTTTYTRYPKLGLVCECDTHLILGVLTKRGPKPDVDEFQLLLDTAVQDTRIKHVLADAGYDSEPNHAYARQQCGVRTTIPARVGRPTKKLPTGRYRRLMAQRFNHERYGQRWQVETAVSMIKRHLGPALRARKYPSQCREMKLMALTHNICIILWSEVFYRAGQLPISA